MVAADLNVGGVEPDIRPVTLDWPREEGIDAFVDVTAQAQNLAFADAVHTEGFDQSINGAGGDALDIGLLSDSECCAEMTAVKHLLGHAAGLEEA